MTYAIYGSGSTLAERIKAARKYASLTQTFGQHREHAVSDAESAEKVAQAIIKTHELLAAYYRTLTE